MSIPYNTISLNGVWQLCTFPVGEGDLQKAASSLKIPCTVPGDIHNALVDSGELKDPVVGIELEKSEYLEKQEWWYSTEFVLTSKDIDTRYFIHFGGLDLCAKVYVNDTFVGNSENAFIPFEWDVTEIIKCGTNTVTVCLDCGLYTLCKQKNIDHYDPNEPGLAIYPQYEAPYWSRVHTRKAQFSYVWDWCRRLVTVGISGSVELRSFKTVRITDVHIYDEFNCESSAHESKPTIYVNVGLDYISDNKNTVFADITMKGYGEELHYSCALNGQNIKTNFKPENPRLWYPNGYGEQALYDISVTIKDGDEVIYSETHRHGIRKVELDRSFIDEDKGYRFTFIVNGIPVFCRGANWIPIDCIPANIKPEKYIKVISEAKKANHNMLRVWGGGIYEPKLFYDLCDENGIMVIQDFMYSCGYYPDDDPEFEENVKHESVSVVKSLRNHASIVMFCGNNECHGGYECFTETLERFFGEKIYDEWLPAIVNEYSPEILYWNGSPYSGRDHSQKSHWNNYDGDTHNWEFAFTDKDSKIDENLLLGGGSKFISETGIPSYSSISSMEKFNDGEIEYNNDVWKFHDCIVNIGRTENIIRQFVSEKQDLTVEEIVGYSQYAQADLFRRYFENILRITPQCMGFLYWHFIDCWGTTGGWSAMDYYLNKKSVWYIFSRVFSPQVLSFDYDNGKIYFINNGKSENNNFTAHYGICFADATPIFEQKKTFSNIPVSSAEIIGDVPSEVINSIKKQQCYWYVKLTDEENNVLYENNAPFEHWINCDYKNSNVSVKIISKEDGYEIQLLADSYTVGFFVDTNSDDISDNALNLEAGKKYLLKASADASPEKWRYFSMNGIIKNIQ